MNENMLKQIIINTIKGEEHLGDNLKRLCVDYINQLQNNWNELKKCTKETIEEFEKNRCILSVFDKGAFATTKVIYHKMQELEQGKDE